MSSYVLKNVGFFSGVKEIVAFSLISYLFSPSGSPAALMTVEYVKVMSRTALMSSDSLLGVVGG